MNVEMIFPAYSPRLLSNSIFNLFELIKAISIPEKNPERKSVMITMVQLFMISLDFPKTIYLFSLQFLFYHEGTKSHIR